MTGNDDISFVDYDGADKAELADARCQQVDLALGMLAGVMRIGLQISDRNIFDSTRLYGATEFIVDLFNLPNAIRRGSLHVSTVNDATEIIFRLIALPNFYRARTGDLRLMGAVSRRGGSTSAWDVSAFLISVIDRPHSMKARTGGHLTQFARERPIRASFYE